MSIFIIMLSTFIVLYFSCRLRIAREKSGSSSLIKNSISCEIPETANSSRDMKTKFEEVEENFSNGSEKFEDIDRKEIPKNGRSEKIEDLLRNPSVKKLPKKLGGTPRSVETESGSPNQSSRKNSNKGRRKSSYFSNGMPSSNSKTPDSCDSVASEKSAKTGTMDDASETARSPYVNSSSVSEKSGSATILEEQIRKTGQNATTNKIESENGKQENLGEALCKMKKQEKVDTS